MQFKKGDKVQVAWKPRMGVSHSVWAKMRAEKGVVVGVCENQHGSSKIIVRLGSGDHVVYDMNQRAHQWVTIKKRRFF